MPTTMLPKHVAIIMDGNGRWAERRGRPRVFGHVRGCGRVRDIIRESDRLGLKALTLYTFSNENWGRPVDEVTVLMKLLYKWLSREQKELMEKNIRFRAIGSIAYLPRQVQKIVYETQEMSASNTGLQVTLALSYGGRQEILNAAQKIANRVKAGELDPEQIDEELFSSELLTNELGDPDLFIRTSGEMRVSNFLLWQIAYTELYFTETYWPDFSVQDFHRAIDSFMRRQRRFGLTASQLEARA